jgi:hypothetical protein
MKQRPRSKHEKTFQELLNEEALRFKDEAAKKKPARHGSRSPSAAGLPGRSRFAFGPVALVPRIAACPCRKLNPAGG